MKLTESTEMLKEAERTGAVKIMIPVSELKFMLQQVSKVEEMQKALKQWENFAIYLTKITSCSMTKNEISHALNTFAQKGESQ